MARVPGAGSGIHRGRLGRHGESPGYIDEFDITYFNGPDLGTRIAQAYRIRGVPETFFVDKSGRLRGVKIGPLYPPELEDKIEELLSEPVAAEAR
jgi:cytochrome c biogenesis protein CcmG/thiol:disulfide interchange protein DsbE